MAYSPVLLVHICAGSVGLLSGSAAIFFRKGSPRHVLAGKVFVASMLVMAVFAVYLAMPAKIRSLDELAQSRLLDRFGRNIL